MKAYYSDDGTDSVKRRYDRIAAVYDWCEWLMEFRIRRWRSDLWQQISRKRILEIGVGTGKNIKFYPRGVTVTAIDFSQKMLEWARVKARKRGADIEFGLADVQRLPYAENSFDMAVATFVFCSVPDPVKGLREVRRVLKPGGRLVLLEHVVSGRFLLRLFMKSLDPVPAHLWGAHIDRETVKNVRMAGFIDISEVDLLLDIVKRIETTATAE